MRPFELLVGDFHHGPYVRVGPDEQAKRALFGGFIDHYSRFIVEGRYYLTEDFAALRFGFRRLLAVHGLPETLYLDNGSAFHGNRFHAACDALGMRLVHSKPYVAEGRGVIERFNRTLKEAIRERGPDPGDPAHPGRTERLVRCLARGTLPPGHPFRDRAVPGGTVRTGGRGPARPGHGSGGGVPAPARAQGRPPEVVHRGSGGPALCRQCRPAWAQGPGALRSFRPGLRPDRLRRPGRGAGRAPEARRGPAAARAFPSPGRERTDYLAQLRTDHERRMRTELSGLRLSPPPAMELDLPGLVALLEACRGPGSPMRSAARRPGSGAACVRWMPVQARSSSTAPGAASAPACTWTSIPPGPGNPTGPHPLRGHHKAKGGQP